MFISEEDNGFHLYPEEAFRSWEMYRQAYSSLLGGIIADQLFTRINVNGSPLLADLAAGEGHGHQILEDRLPEGTSIVSADYDYTSLTNDRWLPNDEEALRVVADAARLPFRSESFDGAISVSGLHTLPIADDSQFRETHRILKQGAPLLITNDTPRGIGIIMQDPELSIMQHIDDESTAVITYDSYGEISEPVVVEVKALDEELKRVSEKFGVDDLSSETYFRYCEATLEEMVFGSIYAQAAKRVLVQGKGYRPFEHNSVGGSWNRLFYRYIKERLKADFPRSNVKQIDRSIDMQTNTVQLGNGLFVRNILKDTVGNLYYSGFTTSEIDHTKLTANFCILAATK